MGNIENRNDQGIIDKQYESQSQLISKLHYIEPLTDPILGPIKIYRFKDAPYDYIMKEYRHYEHSKQQFLKMTLTYYQKQLKHKNIAKLQYFEVTQKYQMCNKAVEVSAYSNYYGITLEQVISQHKKNDIRFTQQELWYVIRTLSEVYRFLNSKFYFLYESFKPNRITVSAQGYIKLFPFYLNQEIPISKLIFSEKNGYQHLKTGNFEDKQDKGIINTSLMYEKAMQNRSNLWQIFPLPPQYLNSIKEGNHEYSSKSGIENLEKEQSFLIGMTIMSMLIEEDIRKYYNYNVSSDQFCTYKHSTVWKDLGILKRAYPNIHHILQKTLQPNPQTRITPQQILAYISMNEDNISIGGSIRMFDDTQTKMKHKLSYRTSIDFDSSVLQGIQPNLLESKLTAGPIQTFTKRQKSSTKQNSQRGTSKDSSDKKISNPLSIKIGIKTAKSRSIRIQTLHNRESEQNKHRNKSNHLLDHSNKYPSSMSLDLDSHFYYGLKNESTSIDQSLVKINGEEGGPQNRNTINITKKVQQKGMLGKEESVQMNGKENRQKISRIRVNSRRGSSLALKINLQ